MKKLRKISAVFPTRIPDHKTTVTALLLDAWRMDAWRCANANHVMAVDSEFCVRKLSCTLPRMKIFQLGIAGVLSWWLQKKISFCKWAPKNLSEQYQVPYLATLSLWTLPSIWILNSWIQPAGPRQKTLLEIQREEAEQARVRAEQEAAEAAARASQNTQASVHSSWARPLSKPSSVPGKNTFKDSKLSVFDLESHPDLWKTDYWWNLTSEFYRWLSEWTDEVR